MSVRGVPARPAVATARSLVLAECTRVGDAWRAEGVPLPRLEGQLIRPLVALAGSGGSGGPDLWLAATAVQLAHEASLLHDDVIDRALERRGAPTAYAARGVAAALVEGDHLLTASYRLAARTGSHAWADLFARAVERTVAGERRQQSNRGRMLTMEDYRAVVLEKSGELLGCAFAAAAVLRGDAGASAYFETGRRLGLCYQMVDDLLDYCAEADTGKTSGGDYANAVWTWPLAFVPNVQWGWDADTLAAALRVRDDEGLVPLQRAAASLRPRFDEVRAEVAALVPADRLVDELLDEWLERADRAVTLHLRSALGSASTSRRGIAGARVTECEPGIDDAIVPVDLPEPPELAAFFARNSRSFSFAARLFPRAERERVAAVYAFCRVTDDIVDSASGDEVRVRARLDAWRALCRRTYDGADSGVTMLDRVLHEAAARGVPFSCIDELIEGMRMDLVKHDYTSLADLRIYTWRVASVVGVWLTRLWGVHDADVLERAADLGHAMQLTNILRDVGEDWRAGRVYLPADLLARYAIDEESLARFAGGEPVSDSYGALIEELMAAADVHYERAFRAIPSLPAFARPAVAAAARVYRGIHDEIRRNGYDNFNRRAHTSFARKLRLAGAALVRLRTLPSASRSRGTIAGRAAALAVAAVLLGGTSAMAQETPREHLDAIEARIAASPADSLLHVDRVRALYFAAVDDEDLLEPLEAELDSIRARWPGLAREQEPLLSAFEGSLYMLRAKHGTWPWHRLSDTRAGLGRLDAAVAAAPKHGEVRYLRLISCYYLPGIFGRDDTVREDFIAMAELIPQMSELYPARFVSDVARFVLEHAELEPEARARLRAYKVPHD